MSDPWTAPESNVDVAGEDRVVPTGDLDPMTVPTLVWEDLKSNPVGYFLSGSAYFLAVMALIVIAIGALGLGMAPGIAMEDETLLTLGGLLGMTVYTVSILVFSFVGYPLMTASTLRAMNNGEKIGFGSPFSTFTEKAGTIVGFYLLSNLAVLVGILFCYVPGIIAAVISSFALPIVVFEDVGPVEAMQKGFDHMRREPLFHVATWLLLFCALIALELTIVGLLVLYPVVIAWQFYAYKVAFK